MGRPTKLTPEIQNRICTALRAGNYRDAAADYAGIDGGTLRRWLARGEREQSGTYRAFRAAVREAEAAAELRVVAQWQQHMPESWQACRDYLERRFPDRWGRRDRLDVTILKRFVAEYAQEKGLDPAPLLAEAEKIAAGAWQK